jgi:hypothetical protein
MEVIIMDRSSEAEFKGRAGEFETMLHVKEVDRLIVGQ